MHTVADICTSHRQPGSLFSHYHGFWIVSAPSILIKMSQAAQQITQNLQFQIFNLFNIFSKDIMLGKKIEKVVFIR